MISQKPTHLFNQELAALSPQDRDQRLRDIESVRDSFAKAKQGLSARYKTQYGSGWETRADYLAEKKVLTDKLESDLLALGFYESLSEDIIESRNRDSIYTAIITHRPASILSMITWIANHFRALQGKAALTESEVQKRLMT